MNGLTGNNLPAAEGDTISLCFICDENHVMPAAVAITSAVINKMPGDIYDIYVVTNNLSDQSISILKNAGTESVRIIIVKAEDCGKYEKFKRSDQYHVTTTCLLKIELPDLLPDGLEKILYLDGDIIVQKDMAEIFRQNIEDVYAGAVRDYYAETEKDDFHKRLNVNHFSYFNAGVLLLNLKKLRENRVPELLMQYRNNHEDKYMDQDTFNVVLGENVRYFPFYCNFQLTSWNYCDRKKLREFYDLNTDDAEYDLINNALVIHYNTWYKPWGYYGFPATDIWLHYYLLSPFKDTVLCRKLLNEEENNKREEELRAVKKTVASQKKEIEKLKKQLKDVKKQEADLSRNLKNVKNGWSYRLGRMVTWLPRKIRDAGCRQEAGTAFLKGNPVIEPYAFIRVKNEVITLKASLDSIIPIIKKGVIAYNECTDGSDLIIKEFCKKNPGFIPFHYPHHVVRANHPDYATGKIPYENTLAAYYNAALALIPQNSWLIKIDCDQIYFPDILKQSFSLPRNNFEVVVYSRLDLVRRDGYVKVIEYKRPWDHWLIYNNNLTFVNRCGYNKKGNYYAWEFLVMPKEYKVLYQPECSSFHFPHEKSYRVSKVDEDKLISLEEFRKTADPKEISPAILEEEVIKRIISSFIV